MYIHECSWRKRSSRVGVNLLKIYAFNNVRSTFLQQQLQLLLHIHLQGQGKGEQGRGCSKKTCTSILIHYAMYTFWRKYADDHHDHHQDQDHDDVVVYNWTRMWNVVKKEEISSSSEKCACGYLAYYYSHSQ